MSPRRASTRRDVAETKVDLGWTDAQREAAEWLIDLKTTDDIRTRLPVFHAWLQKAPENRPTYLALEQAWRTAENAMAPIGRSRSKEVEQFLSEVHAAAARRRNWRRWVGFAVGAGTLLIAGLIFLLVPMRGLSPTWVQYETRYGELRQVNLPDGSLIYLNTNSRMRVRMTLLRREILLQQGEALFVVAHDPSRPLTVLVDELMVRAIGTEFSVRRESDDVITALVAEGQVEMSYRDAKGPLHEEITTHRVVAAAGEAVRIKRGGLRIENVGVSSVKQRLAWTNQMIDFDGTVAEAVAEFNRYNTHRLEIKDASIGLRHIQGRFKATDPEGFCREVQRSLKIACELSGATSASSGVIQLGVTP